MGSFNYTWNYVRNYTGGFGTSSSFTPNQLINTVGCSDSTAPCTDTGMAQYYNWQGKINSTVTLPLGFKVTPILRLQSGIPFGRTFSTATAFTKAAWILVFQNPHSQSTATFSQNLSVQNEPQRLPYSTYELRSSSFSKSGTSRQVSSTFTTSSMRMAIRRLQPLRDQVF